jgi:uncharacterized protein YdbL (DUF1318 family)
MNTRFLALLTVSVVLTATAFAESAADIRRRMEQRLPALDQLKAAAAIGENNRGLVEVRGNAPDAGPLVAAENADRGLVYAIIARETGATPDSVGRARAKQIAANSRAGVWVQDESGRWARK